jgi:hypothetical protein
VSVRIFGDDLDDDDKTVLLNLSNPVGAEIAVVQGTGTILDDDDSPTLSIADVTLDEGTSDTVLTTPFEFTVTLSEASDRTVTVDFFTEDDSAVSTSDYESQSGTLTFLPGETEKMITVAVAADDVAEADETFFVSLTNATNATLADGSASGNITNDDAVLATLEIGNVTVSEGDDTATFTVNVVGDFDSDIMVDFATSDDTAVAGEDYTANSGTLTIPVGQTSGTITVTLTDDALDEDEETFIVTLSNPVNAVIGDPEGTATVIDDDDPPVLTFQEMDVEIIEGDSGTTNGEFVVVLSAPSGKQVTFQFVVSGITATVDEDFIVPASLMGVIEPGETQTTITIPVIGDTLVEGVETFDVELMQPVNATLGAQSIAFGDILNDDEGDPTLSIDDVMVDEGDSGFTNATFTVSLSRALDNDVTFDFATADGTAIAGTDYQASSGMDLTILAGETTRTFTVSVIGDLIQENDETFTVMLSNVTGVAVADGEGLGTILDDDAPPTISINNAQVTEADGAAVNAVFTVTLSEASSQTVTVDFTATSDSATLGVDFLATANTLTFNPGETTKQISVPVVGDFEVENTETFFVNLSNPTNATLADGQGVGTILDDDEEGEFTPASVSGVVWVDVNGDGQRNATEQGLAGVTIQLTGADDFGNPVSRVTTTAADGSYSFTNLVAGNYVVTETQPAQFTDGADNVGNLGGTAAFDQFFLELEAGENGVNYNFGERGLRPEFIGRHLFFVP